VTQLRTLIDGWRAAASGGAESTLQKCADELAARLEHYGPVGTTPPKPGV